MRILYLQVQLLLFAVNVICYNETEEFIGISSSGYEPLEESYTTNVLRILQEMKSDSKKFELKMTAKMDEFQSDMTELKSDMTKMKSDLAADMTKMKSDLAADMTELKSDLAADMKKIKMEIIDEVRKRNHDYVADLASILAKVTLPTQCVDYPTHRATEHNVYYGGYVFAVTVKHSKCANDNSYYHMKDIDVAYRSGCPRSEYVMNCTSHAPLRTGDEASTFGFVEEGDSRFWHGRLSGRSRINVAHDGAYFIDDEYIFDGGAQQKGMSGGATLNGHGYTGMVHAVQTYVVNDLKIEMPLPLVIPAAKILAGFDSVNQSVKEKHFKLAASCPGVEIINLPAY